MTKNEAIKIITDSPELKKAAYTALKANRIMEFLKEHDIAVSEAEVKEYLQSNNQELSPDELNTVAAGLVDDTSKGC